VGHRRHGRAATMMGERMMVLGGAWTTRSTGDDGGRPATTVDVQRANTRWRRPKCKVAASKCEGRRNQVVFKF
jgi:hypothetical protein